MSLDNYRCVVLNATYEPLHIVSARRGLMIVLKGKASIVSQHEDAAETATQRFPVPSQILLKEYIKGRPSSRVNSTLTQRNLFTRDNHTCQYCGRTKNQLGPEEILTRDHIVPQERGGPNTWANCITSCNRCNNRKANYSLDEFIEMLYNELEELETNLSSLSAEESTEEVVDHISQITKQIPQVMAMIEGAEKLKTYTPRTPSVLEILARRLHVINNT